MRTSFRFAAVLIAALSFAYGAGAPSAASSGDDCEAEASQLLDRLTTTEAGERTVPTQQVEVCGYDVGLAELEDLRFLAEDKGMALTDVFEQYGWQEEFGRVANDLRTEYPDQYAGARFEAQGESWIAFRSDVPVGVSTEIGDLPIATVEGRGFSEAELNETLVETFTNISDREDVVSSAGGYDQETGEITIEVVAEDREAEGAIAAEAWTTENPAITIDVEIIDEPAWGPQTHLRGGGYTNTSGCTSAFGVSHTDGRTGLATAHHCATIAGTSSVHSTDRYRNHGSTAETDLFYRNRRSGNYGDIAWYGRNDHDSTNSFYFDYNSTRSVSGTAMPVEGQTIFKFGRTSGRDHHEVYRLNECVNYSDYPQYCGLTAMHRNITEPGDSGGPWYYGNTAYGITSGYKTIWFFQRSLFTPVQSNLFNGMNVLVQTN